MAWELNKHLRIERPSATRRRGWQLVPNGEHVTIWEMTQADTVDERGRAAGKRHIFHVDFIEGVAKGCRAIVFGETYTIVEVSDSARRLRGLELRCERSTGQ